VSWLRLFLFLSWTALGGLKLAPLALDSTKSSWPLLLIGVAEIGIGSSFLFRRTFKAGAVCSIVLGTAFLIGTMTQLEVTKFLSKSCGCFGPWWHAEPAIRRVVASALLLGGCGLLSPTGIADRRVVRDSST
jgi:hypothetical protein